jgi:hypothetical protein
MKLSSTFSAAKGKSILGFASRGVRGSNPLSPPFFDKVGL